MRIIPMKTAISQAKTQEEKEDMEKEEEEDYM
jgi:hypothetical protein